MSYCYFNGTRHQYPESCQAVASPAHQDQFCVSSICSGLSLHWPDGSGPGVSGVSWNWTFRSRLFRIQIKAIVAGSSSRTGLADTFVLFILMGKDFNYLNKTEKLSYILMNMRNCCLLEQ